MRELTHLLGGDELTNNLLADSNWATQLGDAASYYLNVKAANPSAHITFTGHSLGGGLASLIAVFFNETAVTFDQAPFRNTATVAIAQEMANYLADKFPPELWLTPLYGFINGTNMLSVRIFNNQSCGITNEYFYIKSKRILF